MSKPNQRRLDRDIPPLRPADIVPFPQVKRVHFVEKTARIAAPRSREAGENMLETAVQKQCRALERQGVAPDFECGGLRYTCTVGRFRDGRIAEIFLGNHKSNSAADMNARDSAIVCSIALQCGADLETISKAFCWDSHGRASGPLGTALDLLTETERGS